MVGASLRRKVPIMYRLISVAWRIYSKVGNGCSHPRVCLGIYNIQEQILSIGSKNHSMAALLVLFTAFIG